MNKYYFVIYLLVLLFSLPLLAQEGEEGPHMTPPPPLNDELLNWMVGEWKGSTTSEMGKSSDHMVCKMDLDGQFLVMTYHSKTEDNRSMSGIGMITLDRDGKPAGYWVDSWRTMSEGKGSREGNISTMNWSTPMGVYVRTTEKIDENTMRITGVMAGPDGKEMRSESELKRVEK